MFVNLTDVFTIEGKSIQIPVEPAIEEVSIGGQTFKVVEKENFELKMANIGKGKVGIEGHTKITFAMNCDRCLKGVRKTVSIVFDRTVYAPETIETASDEADDQSFMDGYQLDLVDLLYNEIVINWPMKILCKPDCRGICKQCGVDLNTGTCDCDTFVPDPRMAVIKDIFNANKEV